MSLHEIMARRRERQDNIIMGFMVGFLVALLLNSYLFL